MLVGLSLAAVHAQAGEIDDFQWRHRAHAGEVKLTANPLTRKWRTAFYANRGFAEPVIRPYASACGFSFGVHNGSKAVLEAGLPDWQVIGADGARIALRLPDADGALVDLTSYRGKVVLVNFWASWCPPCRKELPSLSRLRKLFGKDEFEIFAVNVGEDPETAFDFIGNPNLPVLFDRDSKTMAAWPAKGMPTSLLIDRQGRIAFRALGGREFDAPGIVAIIRQLLKS